MSCFSYSILQIEWFYIHKTRWFIQKVYYYFEGFFSDVISPEYNTYPPLSSVRVDQNCVSFSYFLEFFLMWAIFKAFIKFVTIWLLFYVLVFFFLLWGRWDVISSTRDRTCILCIGRWSLNHWTIREDPRIVFVKFWVLP